jgi:hypothetical protein
MMAMYWFFIGNGGKYFFRIGDRDNGRFINEELKSGKYSFRNRQSAASICSLRHMEDGACHLSIDTFLIGEAKRLRACGREMGIPCVIIALQFKTFLCEHFIKHNPQRFETENALFPALVY